MDTNIPARASIVNRQSDDTVGEDWDSGRNEETLRLAFEESVALSPVYGQWADAIDRKLLAVFGLASVIISLAPSLQWGSGLVGGPRYAWYVAAGAWGVVAGLCYVAYRPRDFRLGPNPATLQNSAWTHLTPTEYRYFSLGDMGKTFEQNRAQIMKKADLLGVMLVFTAVEVVALLVAFLGR